MGLTDAVSDVILARANATWQHWKRERKQPNTLKANQKRPYHPQLGMKFIRNRHHPPAVIFRNPCEGGAKPRSQAGQPPRGGASIIRAPSGDPVGTQRSHMLRSFLFLISLSLFGPFFRFFSCFCCVFSSFAPHRNTHTHTQRERERERDTHTHTYIFSLALKGWAAAVVGGGGGGGGGGGAGWRDRLMGLLKRQRASSFRTQ